jgi:UDP-N-acetylmuramoyl-tripeptide--D-alanyl-D-alanine ligase
MDIPALYHRFKECKTVCTDTRKISDNCLFFALKGTSFDGNAFAQKAIMSGARYAVIDNPDYANDSTILVDDVLKTLQALANYHRKQTECTILAITGSNGKTTTKELLHAVLSSHYNTLATSGNLNNHIGVPLTLLRLQPETEIGIIEMGANHHGEIADLCRIAEPDYGLITNVGKAHLEGFGSFEGVKKAKGEMYQYLKDHGICFINIDNPHLTNMLGDQECISYGFNRNAWCTATVGEYNRFIGLEWESRNGEGSFVSRLRGTYNAENLLAATCVGSNFSVPSEKIDTALREYTPGNQRSEIREGKHNTLFLDMYNANPSSMELAIKDFHDPSEKQMLILGDMKELGNTSFEAHADILRLAGDLGFDQVFLCGPEFYKHKQGMDFHFFETTDGLKSHFTHHPPKGYSVFIKGSRSMQLESLIGLL